MGARLARVRAAAAIASADTERFSGDTGDEGIANFRWDGMGKDSQCAMADIDVTASTSDVW